MAVTKLDRELDKLATTSREDLVARWQAAYGCPPPAGARRELLLQGAGWHLQKKRLGGFTGEVRRILRREIERIKREGHSAVSSSVAEVARLRGASIFSAGGMDKLGVSSEANVDHRVARRKLVPGARLLRDWNGKTHAVDVTDSGYVYDGTSYRSLSAIARRITGAHWSGPRFFGL